jgi:hypothetical protein
MAADVVNFFMALLSFVDSAPRAYRLKAGNACSPFSTLIAVMVIEWHGASGVIKKIEAGAEPGSAGQLLTFLKSVADKHRVFLIGNVSAYATAARPVANQVRAIAFYECHGFQVGGLPDYAIRYPR